MSRAVLFVYGSLKRGFYHHAEMRGAEFVGEARTAPAFTLYRFGWYPALADRGTTSVRGELYLVTAEHLRELDAFEGDPYRLSTISLQDGRDACAYLVDGALVMDCPEIPSGDWVE